MNPSQEVLKIVTPAPGFRRDRVAGVQNFLEFPDSAGVHPPQAGRNDRKERSLTFDEVAKE